MIRKHGGLSEVKDPWVYAITIMIVVAIIGLSTSSIFNTFFKVEMERENNKLNVQLNIDKLTYCIQTVMESSIKSGKPIDANKAKEICSSPLNI